MQNDHLVTALHSFLVTIHSLRYFTHFPLSLYLPYFLQQTLYIPRSLLVAPPPIDASRHSA